MTPASASYHSDYTMQASFQVAIELYILFWKEASLLMNEEAFKEPQTTRIYSPKAGNRFNVSSCGCQRHVVCATSCRGKLRDQHLQLQQPWCNKPPCVLNISGTLLH